MDTSSMNFCPFSPLRTPQGKKFKKAGGEESDIDTAVQGIARSVQKRLSNSAQMSEDDSDLFLTQEFPEDSKRKRQGKENSKSKGKLQFSPKKASLSSTAEKSPMKSMDSPSKKSSSRKLKPSVTSDSDSDASENLNKSRGKTNVRSDSESGSESESLLKDKRSSINSENTESFKKPTAVLSKKSEGKSPIKNAGSNVKGQVTPVRESHAMSDSESSDTSLNASDDDTNNATVSSEKSHQKLKSKSGKDTNKPKPTGENLSPQKSLSNTVEAKRLRDVDSDSSSVSSVSSLSDSDVEEDQVKNTKTNRNEPSPIKKKLDKKAVRKESESRDSSSDSDLSMDESTARLKSPGKKSKKTPESRETTDEQRNDDGRFSRYKIPANFQVNEDLDSMCVNQSDLKGKQLWLIHAPASFDIGCLNKQNMCLSGTSVITAQETDKQYEVITKKFTTNEKELSYHSVVLNNKHSLAVGAGMNGEVFVTEWIPDLPPVTLQKTTPFKHTVPVNLQSSYELFGSASPERSECPSEGYSSRKSKEKKRKRQEKITMETELIMNGDVTETRAMVTDGENEHSREKKAKKKKKTKHDDGVAFETEFSVNLTSTFDNSIEVESCDINNSSKKKKKRKSKHGEDRTLETENSVDSLNAADTSVMDDTQEDISNAADCSLVTEAGNESSGKKAKKKKKKRTHGDDDTVVNVHSTDTGPAGDAELLTSHDDAADGSKKAKKKKKSKFRDTEL